MRRCLANEPMTKVTDPKSKATGRGREGPSRPQSEGALAPSRLLAWFQTAKRDLPWRGTSDPYAIWVSEVMLQQTRVEVVKRYYAAWMRKFPDVQALARARTEDVLHVWQGLGYYSRARRLQTGALYVVREHGGRLPVEQDNLRKIPGVGAYSAGAIGSIAYGERVPAIDGNVVRVACRYWAMAGDPTKTPLKNLIVERVTNWLPRSSVGDFNQALMELGATICLPRGPLCSTCPIREGCQAFSQGLTANLPTPKARLPQARVRAVPLILSERGKILVMRLGDDARWWAGLTVLPTLELGRGSAGALDRLALDPSALSSSAVDVEDRVREAFGGLVDVRLLESISHTVTRHRIELVPAVVRARGGTLRALPALQGTRASLAWVRATELGGEPLAAPFRKIMELHFDKRS